MTYVLDYAYVSPTIVANRIRNSIPGVACMCHDLNEDMFEISVAMYNGIGKYRAMTPTEISVLQAILKPYIYNAGVNKRRGEK